MAAITAEMALEVSRFRAGINQLNRLLRSHAQQGERAGKEHGRNYSRGFSREVGTMFRNLLAVAGLTSIGFAAGQQFVKSMQDAADRERFEVGVAALTGDPTAGNELFDRFRTLARETGAELDQLLLQSRRAIGQGMPVDEADRMVRSALDIQGSLALTNEETQRLINGFLQVRSKGVAAMEELRQQIAEKGVPIFEALQGTLGIEGKDFFKAVEQGLIPAEAVLDVFVNLRGEFERFRGGALKMAQTLGGAWNIVKAEIRDLRVEFSEPLADTIRPILRESAGLIRSLNDEAGEFGGTLASGLGNIRAAIQELSGGEMVDLLGDGLRLAFLGGVVAIEDGIDGALEMLADGAYWVAFESNLLNIGRNFVEVISDGIMEAMGFVDPKKMLRREWKTGDIVNDGNGNLRRLTTAEAMARNSNLDFSAFEKWREDLGRRYGNRDEELAYLREDLEQRMQAIRHRRLSNEEDERQKQADLRRNNDALEDRPFVKAFREFQARRDAQLASDAEKERADLNRFPGLRNLARMTSNFGQPFAGAFGSEFTGTAGTGGFKSNVGKVSLQTATDYIFDGRMSEIGRQTDLLSRIEASLQRIEQKPIPQPPKPSSVPVFGGRL